MTTIQQALRNILSWPYMRNGGEPFEQQVAVEISGKMNLPVYLHRAPRSCPESIVKQPNGAQMPPDLLITSHVFVLSVECKSAKSESNLMWNSGVPELGTLYLFNCDKGTTALFGDQVIDQATADLLRGIKGSLAHVKTEYNVRLNGSGSLWRVQHIRPMFNQIASERNWLTHPLRSAREQDAMSRCGFTNGVDNG
jgi:hypothetical protein